MSMLHQYLDINELALDPDNPRLAHQLERFNALTDSEDLEKTLEWALTPSDAKFSELRQAIVTHGGVINPIIVNHTDGKYLVIEGNTRLTIYRILHKETPDDTRWQKISCFVHENMPKEAIEAVRLQAHLVGIRNWKPFAKAKYLHFLYEEKKLTPDELVDFCGGNRVKVMRTINAYKEMIDYYLPLVPDDDDNTDKFSIFFEAQKPVIRETLLEHRYKPNDLAKWIAEGKFEPRQELIRKLPDIMNNSRSREVFLREGAAKAELYVERSEIPEELANASFLELCKALETVMEKLGRPEMRVLRDNISKFEDTIKGLVSLYDEELKSHSEMPLDIEIS